MQDGAELLVNKLDVEGAEQEAAQKNAALAAEHELRLSQQTTVPLQPLYKTMFEHTMSLCKKSWNTSIEHPSDAWTGHGDIKGCAG